MEAGAEAVVAVAEAENNDQASVLSRLLRAWDRTSLHPASDPPKCVVGPLLQKVTKEVDSETSLNYSVRKQLVQSTA